jgi:hypothetical protein
MVGSGIKHPGSATLPSTYYSGKKEPDDVSDDNNSNDVKMSTADSADDPLAQSAHRPLNFSLSESRSSSSSTAGAPSHFRAAYPYYLALSSAAAATAARVIMPHEFLPSNSATYSQSVKHELKPVLLPSTRSSHSQAVCDLSTGLTASVSGRSGHKSQQHPPRPDVKPVLSHSLHPMTAHCGGGGGQEELLRIAQLLPREPLPRQVARRIAESGIFDDESSNASNSPENLSLRKQ